MKPAGIVWGNDPFLYGEKVKAYLRKGARLIYLEAAAKRLHDMEYKKAGLCGILKIAGPALLISSKRDIMWPSELAAKQVRKRLQDYSFPYFYQHLSHDFGGHFLFQWNCG